MCSYVFGFWSNTSLTCNRIQVEALHANDHIAYLVTVLHSGTCLPFRVDHSISVAKVSRSTFKLYGTSTSNAKEPCSLVIISGVEVS